jgi:branched-chain amino acid transport system substrate-binding protein
MTSSSPTSPSARSSSFVERGKVDFVVGPVFSNILGAIAKPVLDSGAFLISPNAGPSTMAGKACNQNFFVTSYQNDQVHQVLGKYAQDQRLQARLHHRAELSGRQGLARRLQELLQGRDRRRGLHPADLDGLRLDLAKIASTKPDVVFAFLPGGSASTSSSSGRRPACSARSRSCRPSPSMNRRCRRSRTRRSACSAA